MLIYKRTKVQGYGLETVKLYLFIDIFIYLMYAS